jgi:long-chain acyl-CoA synthetase
MARDPFTQAREMIEEKLTIPSLFLYATTRYANPEAFLERVRSGFEPVSMEEFRRLVVDLSLGLTQAGMEEGDRVALVSENRIEWAAVDFAVSCAGGVTVPISPLASLAQTSHMIRDSGARFAVVSTREIARKLAAGTETGARDLAVYCMEGKDEGDIKSLEDLALLGRGNEATAEALFLERALSVRKEDLSTIMYTSGTGGMPKGVRLSHANIVSNVLATSKALRVTPEDRCLSFLPLSHALERTAGFLTIFFNGASIAYAESVHTLSRDMREARPTILVSVPRLYEKIEKALRLESQRSAWPKRWFIARALSLAKEVGRARTRGEKPAMSLRAKLRLADFLVYRKVRAQFGGRVRLFISGGAPIDRALAETLYGCGILVLEGYGLTEASPICTVNRPESFKFGSVGLPLPGVSVEIAQDGEVLVKGENVMRGYQNLEEETRQYHVDGWLHTGDLGALDEEGFLTLTGRKKELLITSWGVNLFPAPIEQCLKRSPFIKDVVLVGDGRPFIAALIVPDPEIIAEHMGGGPGLTSRDLPENEGVRRLLVKEIESLSSHLSPGERIKEFAILPAEFSMEKGEITTTMKLVRSVIERNYRREIEFIYGKGLAPSPEDSKVQNVR